MKLIALLTIIVISFTSMGFMPPKDINEAIQRLGNDLAEFTVELEGFIPKWYEGKQFDIRTLSRNFIFVTISEIIHINGHNILVVIKINEGATIYIPFNKIT